jgi:hypothetical protein
MLSMTREMPMSSIGSSVIGTPFTYGLGNLLFSQQVTQRFGGLEVRKINIFTLFIYA